MTDLAPLLECLAWRDDEARAIADRSSFRIVWMARALALRHPALLPRWAGLPPELIARVLRSPYTSQVVLAGESLADLEARLAVENGDGDGWSILGDFHIRRERRVATRTLACGIPVDGSLVERIARPAAGLVEPADYPDDQLAGVLERIDRAIELLAAYAPAAHFAVTELTSNLVLRLDRGRPSGLRSASSPVTLGRTVLVDPHVAASPGALAEALVHETVHCLLSIHELEFPFLRNGSAAYVISPWTGDGLPLHAFVHASLVWYSLAQLWIRIDDPELASERSRRLDEIRSGFASLRFETTTVAHREQLEVSVPGLLELARERALIS